MFLSVFSTRASSRTASYLVTTLTSLSLALQGVNAIADSRVCYNSSDSAVPGHRPCFAPGTKSVSHCCSTVDTCVGDTLCLSQFGTLYIGSCTVQGWSSGSNGRGDCPKYYANCKANAGWDIALCNYTNGQWEYCCGALQGINKCCSHDRFTITNTTNEFLNQRQWESDTSTTQPLNSSAPSSSAVTCEATRSSSDKGARIGIGVGLGIPLLITLGLLFWEYRKRRSTEAATDHGGAPEDYLQQRQGYEAVQVYEASGMKSTRGELPSPPPVHELH